MKITILMGSPRTRGNTELLASAFAEGASKVHDVEILHVADYDIHPCIGCNACFRNESHRCCRKDDMDILYDKLKDTDMLVIATPVYFYGISAQLKTVIDRLHNPLRDTFHIRKMALLCVGAATILELFDAIIIQYRLCLRFFNIEDAGMLLVRGVREKGDIASNPALGQARELGANLKD